jgi:regulatory protein
MPFRVRRKPEPLDEAALYQYAVGALGRQMRTVSELKRLMSRRVEEGEAGASKIAAVVERLAEQHYLDDTAFASTYTRLRQENQSFGKRRVRQELARKGVDAGLVSSTLEAAYQDLPEADLVRQYIARKRIQKPQDEKQAEKVVRRLAAAGFSFPVITAQLKNWEIDMALPEDDDEAETLSGN